MAKDEEILTLLAKMMEEQREHRSETANSFAHLDKKVDLHIQKTEYELARINTQDEIQNKLLDQHIEGVQTLKRMFENHEQQDFERFQKLEEPRKWIQGTLKIFLAFGGLGTAIVGIMKLLVWLKGA